MPFKCVLLGEIRTRGGWSWCFWAARAKDAENSKDDDADEDEDTTLAREVEALAIIDASIFFSFVLNTKAYPFLWDTHNEQRSREEKKETRLKEN